MAKFLTGILICLIASMNASAITFESGQHVVSLDIGYPCNVTDSKIIHTTDLSGNDITTYATQINDNLVIFTQPSEIKYTVASQSIVCSLIALGVDKGTITMVTRKIEGCNGLVGSGIRLDNQKTIYVAMYTKQDNCGVTIFGWDPAANDFQKAVKTIKVTRK